VLDQWACLLQELKPGTIHFSVIALIGLRADILDDDLSLMEGAVLEKAETRVQTQDVLDVLSKAKLSSNRKEAITVQRRDDRG